MERAVCTEITPDPNVRRGFAFLMRRVISQTRLELAESRRRVLAETVGVDANMLYLSCKKAPCSGLTRKIRFS
jgi:hypothetical protein